MNELYLTWNTNYALVVTSSSRQFYKKWDWSLYLLRGWIIESYHLQINAEPICNITFHFFHQFPYLPSTIILILNNYEEFLDFHIGRQIRETPGTLLYETLTVFVYNLTDNWLIFQWHDRHIRALITEKTPWQTWNSFAVSNEANSNFTEGSQLLAQSNKIECNQVEISSSAVSTRVASSFRFDASSLYMEGEVARLSPTPSPTSSCS